MSEPRVPRLAADQLTPEQRELYDSIAGGRRASMTRVLPLTDAEGHLHGPFNALLHAPAIGRAVADLGEAVRFAASLAPRAREIVTLVTAAQHRSGFEWEAHEPIATSLGLEAEALSAIRRCLVPEFGDEGERAAYRLAAETVRGDGVSDATWRNAVDVLGMQATVEVTVIVGYYTLLALTMRAHEVGAILKDD